MNFLHSYLSCRLSGSGLLMMLLAAPAWSSPALDALIAKGLTRNPELAAQLLTLEASRQSLNEANAARKPVIGLSARASVAEGGRTFDIPIGDALNPVYRNLEQINSQANVPNAPKYPTLQNQSNKLLRPREQETKITLTAPLYVPTLAPKINAVAASGQASAAQVESVARHLVRDIKVAYYGLQQAQAQQLVLSSSEQLLKENLRVNQALLAQGKITRDAVLRAEAELLAVQQTMAEVKFQADFAGRRLNVLTHQPQDNVIVAKGPLNPQTDALQMDDFQVSPELRQIQAGVEARKQLEAAARNSFLPTVGFAADAGIQGTSYASAPGSGFAIASVVLSWNFSDGGARDAQLGQALALRQQQEAQQENARNLLENVLRSAAERLKLSISQLSTAQARQSASEEAFRIALKKKDAGSLTQLEFFDSQRSLTDARQSVVTATAQLNSAAAEFELAKSSYVLPSHLTQANAWAQGTQP
jgi:outer membrane protein TolC